MRRVCAKLKSFLISCFMIAFATKMLLSLHVNNTKVYTYGRSSYGYELFYKQGKENIIEWKFRNGNKSKLSSLASRNKTTFVNVSFSQDVALRWNSRSLISHLRNNRYAVFEQVITQNEHDDMMDLFKTFKNICESNNLHFMMYGGSLLGAYRHFGIIPWDDDIDVFMNISDANNLKTVFRNISGFSMSAEVGRQWKFYRNSTTVNETCCYTANTDFGGSVCQCNRWPYIDIFFFRENDTHIWDSNKLYSDIYCYKKVDVFPLISFPFENFIIPVPRNIRKILDKSYNVDLCVTLHFSHRKERRSEKMHTVPCKRLFRYFPFVFENYYADILTRSLFLANDLLYEVSFKVDL